MCQHLYKLPYDYTPWPLFNRDEVVVVATLGFFSPLFNALLNSEMSSGHYFSILSAHCSEKISPFIMMAYLRMQKNSWFHEQFILRTVYKWFSEILIFLAFYNQRLILPLFYACFCWYGCWRPNPIQWYQIPHQRTLVLEIREVATTYPLVKTA